MTQLYLTQLQDKIDVMAAKRVYRPLTKKLKEEWYPIYATNLNGFESPERKLVIDGIEVASKLERVVVGDFGAYAEIHPDNLLVELECQPKQEWRLNDDYLAKRKLNIKYQWFHFNQRKVYFQKDTVKYADYKPGYYYISVLYFDYKEVK